MNERRNLQNNGSYESLNYKNLEELEEKPMVKKITRYQIEEALQ